MFFNTTNEEIGMKKSDKIIILMFVCVIITIITVSGITFYRYFNSKGETKPFISENKQEVEYSDDFIKQAIEDGKANNFTKKFQLPKISEGNNKEVNMVIIGTPYYKIALQAYIDKMKYGQDVTIDQIRTRFDQLEINDTIFFSAKINKSSDDCRIVLLQNGERIEGEALESSDQGIILKKYKLEEINLKKSAIIRIQDKYNESVFDEYKVDFTKYH